MACFSRIKTLALLPVITAWAQGKAVERLTYGEWKEYEGDDAPDFSLDVACYRIKAPEKWINLFKDGTKTGGGYVKASRVYSSEREAQQHKNEFTGHIFLKSIRLDD